MRLILPIAAFLASTMPAAACISPAKDTVVRLSSVIVDGEFVVSDESKGLGYILPKRVKKGRRLARYEIRWDANEAEAFQEHERDCMVAIPESGRFETFWLARDAERTFRIIGRGERVKGS